MFCICIRSLKISVKFIMKLEMWPNDTDALFHKIKKESDRQTDIWTRSICGMPRICLVKLDRKGSS